jgi:nucleotide-binding universal stress UspA family protein
MKILLAIDGSPCSEVAVKEVATMQWPAGSQVKILSAVAVSQPNAPDPLRVVHPMRLELLEKEQARLLDLVARTADWLRSNAVENSLQIETVVIEGEPKVVIIEEADQWGADLIVVGCHGYGPIKRFLLGSVSLAVAVHAPCSVEIVRHRHRSSSKNHESVNDTGNNS